MSIPTPCGAPLKSSASGTLSRWPSIVDPYLPFVRQVLLHQADVTVLEGERYRVHESEQEATAEEEEVTPAADILQPDSNPTLYVSSVLTLYVDVPDIPLRTTASDQWLARRFHDDGAVLHLVQTALLLASLRRLIRPGDAPQLSPMRSLAYFRPVIDELRSHPVPENYLEYLRLKLREAVAALRDVQKSTFSDDRYNPRKGMCNQPDWFQ